MARSLREDVSSWLEHARARFRTAESPVRLEQLGRVAEVGDGIATVVGLPETGLEELLLLGNGVPALALQLEADRIGCVLLGEDASLSAGSEARRSGDEVRVPVGLELLGRVVSPLGEPLDGGDAIRSERRDPVEAPAPGIVDRDLVTQPLHTGLTVIDAAIPLGRGQRQLIIGDRKTGKTAVAVDTILSQRGSDVVAVYAAIGQKASTVSRVVDSLRARGGLARTVVVVGEADAPPGVQWLTPYAACAMAEYFRDRGQHALLVLDDLTKHAAIYRQISLLLRSPPGREAYPGDIFYVHSRLLERAAKLSTARGGGSLTALVIAETQGGNLTAYIPTNLVSITDGQVYLESQLFWAGQRPAVNVGKSVSRVGGKTQRPAMRQVAQSLRLEYAQLTELEVFTRFGAVLEERTRKAVEHGRRVRAMLSQPELSPLTAGEQVALLLALQQGVLDAIPLERVDDCKRALFEALMERAQDVLARIEETGLLSEGDRARLVLLAREAGAVAGREGGRP